jgi:predicted nucleic acid-binding protein
MKEKVFVDTNIFVYLKLRDEKNRDKKYASENLFKKIKGRITISSHLVRELAPSQPQRLQQLWLFL